MSEKQKNNASKPANHKVANDKPLPAYEEKQSTEAPKFDQARPFPPA